MKALMSKRRTKPLTIKERAKALASWTRSAYSADAYYSWPAVAEALLRRGYTEAETEAIMFSKYTRWARDYAGDIRKDARCGRYSANDVIRYLKKASNNRIMKERMMIAELMAEQ